MDFENFILASEYLACYQDHWDKITFYKRKKNDKSNL